MAMTKIIIAAERTLFRPNLIVARSIRLQVLSADDRDEHARRRGVRENAANVANIDDFNF